MAGDVRPASEALHASPTIPPAVAEIALERRRDLEPDAIEQRIA